MRVRRGAETGAGAENQTMETTKTYANDGRYFLVTPARKRHETPTYYGANLKPVLFRASAHRYADKAEAQAAADQIGGETFVADARGF